MDAMPEDEKPTECYSCGFATADLKSYPRRRIPSTDERKWLCGLCASTPAGTAYDYPEQYPDRASIKTICYVGNVLLKAMRER